MNTDKHSLIAYLATLLAIVALCLAAAIICLTVSAVDEVHVARIIAALGFIGAAVTGLIGVIGTFRPQKPDAGNSQADSNLATALDKLPPRTEGTGPAVAAEPPAT
jgi:hypothetical protein